MASNSHCSASLVKRRSNSSPQLHCEATDFLSISGIGTSIGSSTVSADVPGATTNHAATSSWSETQSDAVIAKNDQVSNSKTSKTKFPLDNVTQASVHWLEPKQRAVMPDRHDQPVVVKPKAKSAVTMGCDRVHDVQISADAGPEPDLCCNETIHYLQGSDSDSEACQPGNQWRKSHASLQKRRRDSSQKFKRLSRVASHLLSKLKLQETKSRTAVKTRKQADQTDDSESENEQPVVRRRSRSLTNRVLKRFGPKDEDVSPECCSAKASPTESPLISGRGKHRSKTKRSSKAGQKAGSSSRGRKTARQTPLVNFAKFDPEKYPIECTEEIERAAREREIEEGIDLQDQGPLHSPTMVQCASPGLASNMQLCTPPALETAVSVETGGNAVSPSADENVDAPTHTTENIYDWYGSLTPTGLFIPRTVHTQIDYMHCLVPDQWDIMKSSFYWGKIDRYEADSLLENKQEGTFLLRDSAQEEFLFSVSFCRYGRTLHARIEQWNHKFSFDAHDPGVYSSDTICGLLEHYKDPNYCMFFEPMLTNPLHRVNPPSLLELSRACICSHVSYDSICYLKLPNSLKEFLREYHYKQRVRIRRVEVDMPQIPDAKQTVVTNTCISR